jgi:hypothetical protein
MGKGKFHCNPQTLSASVASSCFIFGLLLKCARAHNRMRVYHDVLSGDQTFVFIDWPGPLLFRDRIISIAIRGTLLMTAGSQRLCSAESIYQPMRRQRFWKCQTGKGNLLSFHVTLPNRVLQFISSGNFKMS